MKALVLASVLLLAFSANGQSLKEALFSGKLKADTGAVLRRGDTATIRENMAQKEADLLIEDSLKKVAADSIREEALAIKKEKALAAGQDTSAVTLTAEDTAQLANPNAVAEAPKDNNTIWQSFVDSLTTLIQTEVLPSPKVKKGAYYVVVDYEIRTDGDVRIKNVMVDPENSYLHQQLKDRFTLDAPKMIPIVDANGRTRNVSRKQVLNFEK